jgi:SPP1 gp7 family putative phage head morphogenesis protein
MQDMKRRFARLAKGIQELVVDLDAFGLKEPSLFKVNVSSQEWRFLTDAAKIKAFQAWLQQQVDAGILETAVSPPWMAAYIDSAYRKGIVRAYALANRPSPFASADFLKGAKASFAAGAFAGPVAVNRLQFLYTRAYTNLKGVTAAMDTQLSMILANGLANGLHPSVLAREMTKTISGLVRTRANAIARTEIIYAHAEGQLDSLKLLGVEGVKAMAEWSTAGDDRVCPKCEPLEGVIMSVDEARGLIPLHPNCRCMWLPANVGEDRTGQLWGSSRDDAIEKSLKAQGGKKKSKWLGKYLV